MKQSNMKYMTLFAALLTLPGCAANHDYHGEGGFILGAATEKNIATQSIRSVEVPNSKGLTGQSGERAVAAIARLNSGDQPELSDVSASGIGSSSNE